MTSSYSVSLLSIVLLIHFRPFSSGSKALISSRIEGDRGSGKDELWALGLISVASFEDDLDVGCVDVLTISIVGVELLSEAASIISSVEGSSTPEVVSGSEVVITVFVSEDPI